MPRRSLVLEIALPSGRRILALACYQVPGARVWHLCLGSGWERAWRISDRP